MDTSGYLMGRFGERGACNPDYTPPLTNLAWVCPSCCLHMATMHVGEGDPDL